MTAIRGPVPRRLALLGVVAILAGCGGGPVLANPPLEFPAPATASPAPSMPGDPIPIVFPRDDGPHDRLTEWWYYTGHLTATDGRTFGFEEVVFRAERGQTPAAWAAHFAITDESAGRFYYAQRADVGPQVDRSRRDASGAPTGFDLNVSGLSPALVAEGAPAFAKPWRLLGSDGTDHVEAALTPEEATASGAQIGIVLALQSTKDPVLHQGNGFIDFGPAGSSYYYSRTRLNATGQLLLNGERLNVTGIAWFDHQWGDFVSVGAGGWDWYAINLDDGTDITISSVLDDHAIPIFQYGTLVRPSGEVLRLAPYDDFNTGDTGRTWQSTTTGASYPAGGVLVLPGSVRIPGIGVAGGVQFLNLEPTVTDQELDTRATTGVVYWEGSEVVTDGSVPNGIGDPPIVGKAYVEITRYDLPSR